MKTITKALIAATLAIVSLSAMTAERFNGFTTERMVTICITDQAVVDLDNARRSYDGAEQRAIMKNECMEIPNYAEFEVVAENRHLSKIMLYDPSCKLLTEAEFYILNTQISPLNTPDEIKKYNSYNNVKVTNMPKCSQD